MCHVNLAYCSKPSNSFKVPVDVAQWLGHLADYCTEGHQFYSESRRYMDHAVLAVHLGKR